MIRPRYIVYNGQMLRVVAVSASVHDPKLVIVEVVGGMKYFRGRDAIYTKEQAVKANVKTS